MTRNKLPGHAYTGEPPVPFPAAQVYCFTGFAGLTIMKKISAETLIRNFGLEVLPLEGGHFRQTYKADETVCVAGPGQESPLLKPRSTAIIYLLSADPDSFSALHMLPTDEIYHFYLGDPVELLLLEQDGASRVITLGHDVMSGQHVQFAAPAGVWQGSRLVPGGGFALLGTTMAPGFIDEDYTPGDRETLVKLYPDRAELISVLTRDGNRGRNSYRARRWHPGTELIPSPGARPRVRVPGAESDIQAQVGGIAERRRSRLLATAESDEIVFFHLTPDRCDARPFV